MPVKVVSLPGGDDPDSFLRKHEAADFQLLLDNAQSIMSFQVRAERLKERSPDSIDAMARISREVLLTIAASKSAVIRAGMIAEAAKLLGLPPSALNEELSKLKTEPAKRFEDPAVKDDFEDIDDYDNSEEDFPLEVEDASLAIPPPELEFAFCGFLMENERDEVVAEMVAEFLPLEVFAHDFTRSFVDVWKMSSTAPEDPFPKFRENLTVRQCSWLDRIFEESAGGRSLGSGESVAHNLENFIRDLWIDYLGRKRGELSVLDQESEAKRFEISYNMRRLKDLKWNSVKTLIREQKKGMM
jgi:hypothetical protein